MKTALWFISPVIFLLSLSHISFAQQTDTSSYFPLGLWGIWTDNNHAPYNPYGLVPSGQWAQEKGQWNTIKGNYLVFWIPEWAEGQVMGFADTSTYRMDVQRCGYGYDPEKSLRLLIEESSLSYARFVDSANVLINQMAQLYSSRPGLYSYSLAHEKPVVNYDT